MDYTVHGILQARILELIAVPFSRDLPDPWIEPRSPTLQDDSLPDEPQGKPKNPGVGSLFLLQGNLPDTKIGLRSTPLQVDSLPTSYQGSPFHFPW